MVGAYNCKSFRFDRIVDASVMTVDKSKALLLVISVLEQGTNDIAVILSSVPEMKEIVLSEINSVSYCGATGHTSRLLGRYVKYLIVRTLTFV